MDTPEDERRPPSLTLAGVASTGIGPQGVVRGMEGGKKPLKPVPVAGQTGRHVTRLLEDRVYDRTRGGAYVCDAAHTLAKRAGDTPPCTLRAAQRPMAHAGERERITERGGVHQCDARR